MRIGALLSIECDNMSVFVASTSGGVLRCVFRLTFDGACSLHAPAFISCRALVQAKELIHRICNMPVLAHFGRDRKHLGVKLQEAGLDTR